MPGYDKIAVVAVEQVKKVAEDNKVVVDVVEEDVVLDKMSIGDVVAVVKVKVDKVDNLLLMMLQVDDIVV